MNAALDNFDDDGAADEPEAQEAQDANGQPADIRLQKAGLEQRIADLEKKQGQLQNALKRELDAAGRQENGPEPQQGPGKQLVLQEDDTFLNEELDNAHNSAMVETERDRLIRLVRALFQLFCSSSGCEHMHYAACKSLASMLQDWQRSAGRAAFDSEDVMITLRAGCAHTL